MRKPTDFTAIARRLMMKRVRAADMWQQRGTEWVQRRQLSWLTERGARTRYGAADGIDRPGGRMESTDSYDIFKSTIPVASYPDIRRPVMRMVAGEKDILWPGRCTRFAQSSGTSDGKSKYIPVTADSLRINHFAGARDAVAHYLAQYPDSRMFAGKGFILGGSFDNELSGLPRGVKVGDLSANLIDAVNPIVNLFRVPSKRVALMADWTEKLPALVEASRGENITNISGVPSWFLTVLRRVIETSGARTIHDVWPGLEVFFHGGISMEPYRRAYAELCDSSRPMRYRETYNASEGFFAAQDTVEPGPMRLLLDIGVFYEFVPLDEFYETDDSPWPRTLAPWQVEKGQTYALVITAPNGLWRYPIGDTVRIESTDPLRITIAGRTKHFINAFGEEVMVHNTDKAVAEASRRTGAHVENYTVAPVFADGDRKGHHQWLIEWGRQPSDIELFADILDRELQNVNSDYQAKRSGSIFMERLEIITAQPGLFDRWLASTGKLGGQRKVPRLSNTRQLMERLLSMM